MNSKLLIGSIVYGAAGIGCKVLAIEGDTLTVETSNGIRKIPSLKVERVETPSNFLKGSTKQVKKRVTKFELGGRVKYIGSDFNLKKQYAGILEVWEVSKNPYDGYTCLKSDGRITSWIHFEDLELEVAQ